MNTGILRGYLSYGDPLGPVDLVRSFKARVSREDTFRCEAKPEDRVVMYGWNTQCGKINARVIIFRGNQSRATRS